jgi:dTDP-4-dehydrorhamnose reductase
VSELLVTGAGGMLGHDVVAAARARGHAVTALAHPDLDVADAAAVHDAFARARADTAINCAAWTDVDGAESDPDGAFAVNAHGATAVAKAASAVGAHLVHVSTDYVFAGDAVRPYVESDPTGPRSQYGRSKLAGEQGIARVSRSAAIVRTSWLFGTAGPNFVETMLGLAAADRDEVAVVTDQVGCPTFTGHLAGALVALAERGAAGIHHVAGSGHCSWNEFAREIFAQAGVDCAVVEATSADMSRPAPRPAWSVLGSERPDRIVLPPWREGLAAYLSQRTRARAPAAKVGRQ